MSSDNLYTLKGQELIDAYETAYNECNAMQQAWLTSFLQYGSASRAARDAGYKHPDTNGWVVMNSPRVSKALALAKRMMRQTLDETDVWGLLRSILMANISDYQNEDGTMREGRIRYDQGRAVKKYKRRTIRHKGQEDETVVEIEFHSPLDAARLAVQLGDMSRGPSDVPSVVIKTNVPVAQLFRPAVKGLPAPNESQPSSTPFEGQGVDDLTGPAHQTRPDPAQAGQSDADGQRTTQQDGIPDDPPQPPAEQPDDHQRPDPGQKGQQEEQDAGQSHPSDERPDTE